ncbi:MAG TPA: arylamine N-acetyltransferase [Burkholderiales bacterium]|nr:arylamine N-acetyltransferase [Burkholderiales bacterium]
MRFDLSAYLKRIGYAGNPRPTLAALEALELAHATHIPFENLDILLGRTIRLDIDSIQAKLVGGGRGGYCFEHNLLFAAALEAAGFAARPLAARVRYRSHRVLPRTHMLLLVEAENKTWIADVGFGLEGILSPLPLVAGRESRQFHWTFRLVEESGQWTVQSHRDGSWIDLYAFSLERQQLADFEMANYYASTHPDSRFTRTLTAQLPTPEARFMLRNRELTVDRGKSVTSRALRDDDELLTILAETFGLRFPAGTRFNYRETPG